MKVNLIFFFLFSIAFGQATFQKNIGVSNKHLHDLNIEPMEDGTDDFIVAGNLFDNSMQDEMLILKRMDVNGNVIWVKQYDHPAYQLIRGFDIAINNNIIVVTGSVDINGIKKVFVISLDASNGVLQNGMYYDVFDPILNSRGLHITYTESDINGDSVPDPGYIVGGFYSDCYNLDTLCSNLGFLIRIDINFNLLWSTKLDSNIATGFPNFDFINHITETSNGFFITGSTTDPNLPSSPLQSVLALKIDFQGNLTWNQSYVFGNSKDVSVDAYYDNSTDNIFMLCNYSQAHYFGVTALNNTTGNISLSNSWVATSGNNYDVYGFTIMESLNSSDNLIIVGYDKEEYWIDNDGTAQFGQNNLFVYEFKKLTGDPVAINYQYLVPHIEPLGDEFNFWNYQLPLIYYPDISFAKGFSDGPFYYHVGYRTETPNTFSEAEIFKTTNDKLNRCEQFEINLTSNSIGLQNLAILYEPTTVVSIPFEPYDVSVNYNEDSCSPNLSVGDNNTENMLIYPNPVNETLYISGKKIQYFIIMDSLGKNILEGKTLEDNSININYLNKGVYFIKLISKGNLQVLKFIKK